MLNTGSGNASPTELHKTTAPQVAGPDPADVEAVAAVLIWVEWGPSAFLKHGTFGLNDPEFVSRYNHRAREVLAALIERGWRPPSSPSSGAGFPADKAGE